MCHQGSRRRTTGASGAAKTPAHNMSIGGSAADVPPSEPQVNDWRGGRAGAITSCAAELAPLNSAARHRAWRVTGVAIWPRPNNRSAATHKASACSSSGFVHAQREGKRARVPRSWEGPHQFKLAAPTCSSFASSDTGAAWFASERTDQATGRRRRAPARVPTRWGSVSP
jgi:hypothetical protein